MKVRGAWACRVRWIPAQLVPEYEYWDDCGEHHIVPEHVIPGHYRNEGEYVLWDLPGTLMGVGDTLSLAVTFTY
jgi:hypothetical protein